MSLNIKDQRVHDLARRLGAMTGESMTAAIRTALKERLMRERRRHRAKARADELVEIGRRCAARLKGKLVDHGVFLYDDRGLPR